MRREIDLRTGAALAGVSYNRFLREVQARNVVVLEEDGFLERLTSLARAFGDDSLQAAVERATTQSAPHPAESQPVDGALDQV